MPESPQLSSRYWPGESCVLGGFLIHLVLGTLYCWANLTTYVTARLRLFDGSLTYEATLPCFAAALGFQGIFMLLGGLIESRIGPRYTALLGGSILSLGVLVYSINHTMTKISGEAFAYCSSPPRQSLSENSFYTMEFSLESDSASHTALLYLRVRGGGRTIRASAPALLCLASDWGPSYSALLPMVSLTLIAWASEQMATTILRVT